MDGVVPGRVDPCEGMGGLVNWRGGHGCCGAWEGMGGLIPKGMGGLVPGRAWVVVVPGRAWVVVVPGKVWMVVPG